MNCTAEKSSRKWPYGAFGRSGTAMVTAVTILVLGMQDGPAFAARRSLLPSPWAGLFGDGPRKPRHHARRTAAQHAAVPLPKQRPPEAPAAVAAQPPAKQPAARQPAEAAEKPNAEKPNEEAAAPPAPQPPSACRQALTDAIAIAPSIPDIHGPGGCGGEDLVRLEAIVLPDKRQVALKPAATLRCAMAAELADWVRSDIAPVAAGLGSEVSTLENLDSFECRGRNGVTGAKLSEHGHANAIDVHAFRLSNGRSIVLTDRVAPREVRETMLHSACTRFTTVLGPGSDGYHEDHIHLDLLERRNNYRICQWDVLEPLPAVAPLLPAERPEEAPPRQVAAKNDAAKNDAAKPDAAKPDAAKPDAGKREEAKPAPPEAVQGKPAKPTKNRPTKKRRQSRRF